MKVDHARRDIASAVIRFAGDSSDGMSLVGTPFANAAVIAGNGLATLPRPPDEIRAPSGSTHGVSSFQLNLASESVDHSGDELDVLVAMNPAALKVSLHDLKVGGMLIVNQDAFNKVNLERARYTSNPLEDGSLSTFRVFPLEISTQTENALRETGLSFREIEHARNFWALGLLHFLYGRPLENSLESIEEEFSARAERVASNKLALKAGYLFGEVSELFPETFAVARASLEPGLYRHISGSQATVWGLVAAAELAKKALFFGSYPISPALGVRDEFLRLQSVGLTAFQAEDEIAAAAAAVGAAYAGQLAVTATSGPGMDLKSEVIGLAVTTELPLVIVDVQRAGPSTGMPNKTAQSDLLQAIMGRHGDCPAVVLAPSTPADCFTRAIEAARIALEHNVPVFLLTDAQLTCSAEAWRIPSDEELPKITPSITHAAPGTPDREHHLSGLERDDAGEISDDPLNHERRVHRRRQKLRKIADELPLLAPFGDLEGGLLLVSWGSTFAVVRQAVRVARAKGLDVSHLHLHHLNPMPKNVGEILKRFARVFAAELNTGQLSQLLRADHLVDVQSFNRVQGRMFTSAEVLAEIEVVLGGAA